jgi:hypothetical protein
MCHNRLNAWTNRVFSGAFDGLTIVNFGENGAFSGHSISIMFVNGIECGIEFQHTTFCNTLCVVKIVLVETPSS